MTRSSPDIVDELYGLADSLMQGSGKTVVISYANIRFAADEIKRLRASLQPATPTSCPYKGPFGCKCEPGECKYRAGGDAVAGEAKHPAEMSTAELATALDLYQRWTVMEPKTHDLLNAAAQRLRAALRSPDAAATPPNRMDKGRAFYLAMYEKDGAIWAANDHKGLWCDTAEDYERRLSGRVAQRPLQPAETQKIAADAIRTFCRSLGAAAVQNSHGVERIYHAGISLDALAAAVALALSSTLRCPNGLEHGNCLHPNCVSSCPGRLALTSPPRDTRPDWKQDKDETSLLPRGAGK